MTNKEWLDYLAQNAPDELAAWFDAERVTNQAEMLHIDALDGRTAAQNADSRERLEADAFAYLQTAYITYPQIIELLDRQAAITAEETSDAWEEYRDVTQREIAELQEQVYELQAALDLISISLALPMTSKPITPDMRKPEVLAKLIIETIKKLANEREHYRSKFSRALGYADDIHALMDDEGMA